MSVVNLTVDDVRARLRMLRAELENCRGGGYTGRLKVRMVEAQIRELEAMLAWVDGKSSGTSSTGPR